MISASPSQQGRPTWRRHSCLQRRDSSRRSARRWTIDSPQRAQPAPLSPGSPRCRPQFDSTPVHLEPSGRRIQPARTLPRCGPRTGSPPWPLLLSGIAVTVKVRFSAIEVRAHGWTGSHKPPDRNAPAMPLAAEPQQSGLRFAPESSTWGRSGWYLGTGPSKRKRRPRRAWRQEDTWHGEGYREDARSRKATFPRDTGAAAGDGILPYPIVHSGSVNSRRNIPLGRKSAETSLGAADTSVCATSAGAA